MHPGTYRLGLTGWPLTYSLSPAIQNAALSTLRLPGEYRLYPVLPLPGGRQAMAHLLERLREGEISGLNVTIPHKQAVLEFLDELTPRARLVGAVNTIFPRGSRLVGDNTDVTGFLADLKRSAPALSLDGKRSNAGRSQALILGAGGAARAAACGLVGSGWRVILAARRLEQAAGLANDLRSAFKGAQVEVVHLPPSFGSHPTIFDLTCDPDQMNGLDLLVNATPAGMVSHENESAWPEALPLPPRAFVYDMVYAPRETALVRRARGSGLAAINGAGMLVEQAAAAFELWTGRAAPRGVMRQAFLGSPTRATKNKP